MQRFCHRKADIAARLGIPLTAVSDDMTFDYELGFMDDGATSTLWLRDYHPEALDVTEWPGDRCTSLAEGVGE